MIFEIEKPREVGESVGVFIGNINRRNVYWNLVSYVVLYSQFVGIDWRYLRQTTIAQNAYFCQTQKSHEMLEIIHHTDRRGVQNRVKMARGPTRSGTEKARPDTSTKSYVRLGPHCFWKKHDKAWHDSTRHDKAR